MVITPKQLADKIITGILRSPNVTYSRLEAHALSLGIPIGVFENSMQLVHKSKKVQSKILKGILVYVEREAPKPKVDVLLEWRKANPYPKMDNTNDCHHEIFNGIDLSFLFLTPDELDEYKNNGRQVFKKKSYEYVKA